MLCKVDLLMGLTESRRAMIVAILVCVVSVLTMFASVREHAGLKHSTTCGSPISSQELTKKSWITNVTTSQIAKPLCRKWIVRLNTGGGTTKNLKRQPVFNDWCSVTVAMHHNQTDTEQRGDRDVFLDWEIQTQLTKEYAFLKLLPMAHISRRNAGYLYALLHGAEMIFDDDDDQVYISSARTSILAQLHDNNSLIDVVEISKNVTAEAKSSSIINSFDVLAAGSQPSWPRGLPLEFVNNPVSPSSTGNNGDTTLRKTERSIALAGIGVAHFIVNHCPDVDTVYRLAINDPVDFALRGQKPWLVSESQLTPYNARSTLHLSSSFVSLMISADESNRCSDVVRSFISQRLFANTPIRVLVSAPISVGLQCAHASHAGNVTADEFSADQKHLALQLDEDERCSRRLHNLLLALDSWYSCADTFADRYFSLMNWLRGRELLSERDWLIHSSWFQLLRSQQVLTVSSLSLKDNRCVLNPNAEIDSSAY